MDISPHIWTTRNYKAKIASEQEIFLIHKMIVSKVISCCTDCCHTDEKYTLFEVEHPTLSVKRDNFHSKKKID